MQTGGWLAGFFIRHWEGFEELELDEITTKKKSWKTGKEMKMGVLDAKVVLVWHLGENPRTSY